MKRQLPDKLAILRANDPFRYWKSLEDKRVCLLCECSFTGYDVVVSGDDASPEVHCPTRGCRSHVDQWVHLGNPLVSDEIYADWWRALSEPAEMARS